VRADRLVSLVLLLQARGQTTAAALAAELGVSVRTIYRDLDGLSAAGVPVLAESGPGGGCRLVDGYRFPLRGLRQEEAEALLILGVPTALTELGLGAAAAAAHRQVRVTAGLDGRQAGDGQHEALVHLDMPQWFRSRDPVPELRTLADAVRQGRQLELSYHREPGSLSTAGSPRPAARRLLAPLGLVNKAGIWYLVAAARDDRVMVLRADRVTDASISAGPARRPPGFDLVGFWREWSREFEDSRPRLPVTLRASPRALAAFPELLGDQVRSAIAAAAADEHGWRELTVSFEHERAAAHRLAGFGAHVEVLSPATVRDELLAAARGILNRYGTDGG
jgi:predicted DNA-binding transcriptional regulator YafY